MTIIAWALIALAAASAVNLWLAMAERSRAGRYWRLGEEANSEATEMVMDAAQAQARVRSALAQASAAVAEAQAREARADKAFNLARDLTAACQEFTVLHEYGAHDEAEEVVTRAFAAIEEGTR